MESRAWGGAASASGSEQQSLRHDLQGENHTIGANLHRHLAGGGEWPGPGFLVEGDGQPGWLTRGSVLGPPKGPFLRSTSLGGPAAHLLPHLGAQSLVAGGWQQVGAGKTLCTLLVRP